LNLSSKKLEKEVKTLKEETFKLCWNMRGGLSYDEGILLSLSEKEIISKIVESNMEITKKTKLPYF
jgi:hypothetical protein